MSPPSRLKGEFPLGGMARSAKGALLFPPDGSRLLYVMGPSGSGKDTLLRLAQAGVRGGEPIRVAQRCITRPGGPDEASRHLSETDFERIERAGGFALHWRSHGLRYGIGIDIDQAMASGWVVLVNGSRRHLATAWQRYPRMTVAQIVVDPAVLACRLARRGREDAAEIVRRLEAASLKTDEGADPRRLHRIDNNGAPESAACALLALARTLL